MANMQDLPLELFSALCQQLALEDLIRVAATCKRIRHGEGGLETVQLPTKSPVVTVLRERAFPHPELVPSTRPAGCSESWVAYLARCARQRRGREAPFIAAGDEHGVFMNAAGQVKASGQGAAIGLGHENLRVAGPFPVALPASAQIRSVAAGRVHSLALGLTGCVYTWGEIEHGQLGQGDTLVRPSPTLLEGLEDVRDVSLVHDHSLAVTQSGAVFSWGVRLGRDAPDGLRPVIVDGFGGVHVRRVFASGNAAFAIGEDKELFSWGSGD
jgi:hypothetical protein